MQTTKDIIMLLPFEQQMKESLLRDFDQLTPDQKFAVERLVWGMYDALYEIKLDENMQLAFARAEKNQEKLDHEFYQRVREQTEWDLQKAFSVTETKTALEVTRQAIQDIQKELSSPK